MNKLAILTVVIAITGLAKTDSAIQHEGSSTFSDSLACVWYPACGDPDVYSPLLTPKDSKSKTETQGTKNEKLA